jgi:hypothetical protein
MDGIHYKPLESCKTQIFLTAALRVDFDACVDLINNMIHSQNLGYSETSTQIATTTAAKSGTKNTQGNSSGGKKKVAFARDVKSGSTPNTRKLVQVLEDQYYSSEEYAKLDLDQKLSLKLLREKKNSGGHPGGNQSKKCGLPKGTQINDDGPRRLWTARLLLPSRLKAPRRRNNTRRYEASLWTWTRNDSRFPLSP